MLLVLLSILITSYRMILIADSGSTKTDWRLIDNNKKIHQYRTTGFNPFLQDTKQISEDLRRELVPKIDTNKIKRIYFYGAGCSSSERVNIVAKAIKENFPRAAVDVEHDLLAAARALCGHNKGIAAILGTGSNSCYYDGNKIARNVGSLGFILGDEGSGAHLGKQLIRHYLYKELPSDLNQAFDNNYKLTRDEILESVYKNPLPNKFLASFSKFIKQNIKHPFANNLVYKSFELFFDKHICKYPERKKVNMHCVGSIGYFFADILQKVAMDKKVSTGIIIESPIAGLTLFHLEEF